MPTFSSEVPWVRRQGNGRSPLLLAHTVTGKQAGRARHDTLALLIEALARRALADLPDARF